MERYDLFTGRQQGYHLYRIPALVVTPSGTVLAFCEGRRYTGRDDDEIDILLRRSFDGGRTWGGSPDGYLGRRSYLRESLSCCRQSHWHRYPAVLQGQPAGLRVPER